MKQYKETYFLLLLDVSVLNMHMHLPGLDSDTGHGAVQIDVPHGDVRHTGFAVVSSEPTDADSMARSTIYVVDVNVRAARLDGDAVIPCVLIRVSVTFPFGPSVKDSVVYTTAHVGMVDHDISRVLQMNPICIEAVAWRSDRDVVDLNSFTVVKLKMALLAVLNCDASH